MVAAEADLEVGIVAERFVLRSATAAKSHRLNPIHVAPGARADLEVAGHLQGAIDLGINPQLAIADLQGIRGPCLRLSRGAETDCVVRAVAIGFVFEAPQRQSVAR